MGPVSATFGPLGAHSLTQPRFHMYMDALVLCLLRFKLHNTSFIFYMLFLQNRKFGEEDGSHLYLFQTAWIWDFLTIFLFDNPSHKICGGVMKTIIYTFGQAGQGCYAVRKHGIRVWDC